MTAWKLPPDKVATRSFNNLDLPVTKKYCKTDAVT